MSASNIVFSLLITLDLAVFLIVFVLLLMLLLVISLDDLTGESDTASPIDEIVFRRFALIIFKKITKNNYKLK